MQRQIAVAFQGGGARLVGLLAAAHALSELEQSLDFNIRAVSGSSAGSVPAFLLAAGANFNRVKDAIRKINPLIKASFPQLDGFALHRKFLRFLITGRSIYNPNDLEKIIEIVLTEIGIDHRMRLSDLSLNKDMFLMYTNLYSASHESALGSDTVKTAILRSCLLPIVFSSHHSVDNGQHVDGGILDNLPTDVLMRSQAEPCPVFAIGFKADIRDTPTSPWTYLYSLASSGIQYRISAAKNAIGEDMALDLSTSIGTLQFNKIVDVGIEKEYEQIKDQTRSFFRAYLSGHGTFTDPLSESRGLAPFYKLKSIERSIYNYVFNSIKAADCVNAYLKMRVNAFSLANPKDYDEIFVEQLIEFPDGDYIKGAILPMTDGAGYTAGVECHAFVGGPEGQEIECEQFLINDNSAEFTRIGGNTNLVVLLFKGDLKKLIGKSVYIIKKETRYGFMLDLRSKEADYLSVRSFYWPAKEISIALSVPKEFRPIRCEWIRENGPQEPQPLAIGAIQNLVPAGYLCYSSMLKDVSLGTRLKGNFYVDKAVPPHEKNLRYAEESR